MIQVSGERFSGNLFIHTRVLLGLDPVVSAFVEERRGNNSVPWQVWGRQNTRWCLDETSTERLPVPSRTYGLKVIDRVPHPSLRGRRLRIRDFNPYATYSKRDALLEDWQYGRLVSGSARILAGQIFAEDVDSHLPYREIITEESFDIAEAMLDHDKIVMSNVRLHVTVFFVPVLMLIFNFKRRAGKDEETLTVLWF